MIAPDGKRRPLVTDGATNPENKIDTDTIPRGTDNLPRLTAAEVYQIIRGRLAAHVITKDAAGRVSCRSYVNLRAADCAVERACARGHAATVVMVRQDVAPLVGGEVQ